MKPYIGFQGHGEEAFKFSQECMYAAIEGMRPSTLEWLATARNYVEFANQSGGYDEVAAFLVSREARSWKD